MRTTHRVLIITALLSLGPASALQAQTKPGRPTPTTEARSSLGASFNNAGLQEAIDVSRRFSLTTSKDALLSDAHLSLGGSLMATPAGVRGGAWLEVAPLSVLSVRAGVEPGRYFGAFHALSSFAQRDDDFTPDARKAQNNAMAASTLRVYLNPVAQARIGRVAVRTSLNVEHWSSTADGPYYYEPTRDTLLASNGDTVLAWSSVILREWTRSHGGVWSIGPSHSLMRVHRSAFNQVQKVGLVSSYQAAGRHYGVNRPSLTVQATYFVDDPSKQGQWGASLQVAFSLRRR